MLTKTRHTGGHNWEDLRADIEGIIKDQRLSPTDFRALSIHEDWKAIEARIYHTFCKLDHPTERPIWLWEYFKLDTTALEIEHPYLYLDHLVDHNETVWFFINGNMHKFWFYEGKVKAITKVIEESCYIDELYLASKKYQWLICINHHDLLFATGQTMPDKLKQLHIAIRPSRLW